MSEDKSALFLYYWRILADGLAEPVAEYRFAPPRKFRFDFCWPEKQVAVEVDGGTFKPHGGRHGTDQDREKRNLAASLGWRMFFFSPQMLKADPDACVGMVARAVYGRQS